MSEGAYDKLLRALMGQEEAKLWAPYFKALGLSDEEMIKRMVRIMVMHFLLDRFLTVVLTNKLLGSSPDSFEKTQVVIAELEMETRIKLAKASQVISDSTASTIKVVNTTRNKLAHYQPKRGWDFAHIPELSSPEAFDQCTHKASEAINELISTLNKMVSSYPSIVPYFVP